MVSSRYRPDDALYGADGDLIPPTFGGGGVYAPGIPPQVAFDPPSVGWIVFPASPEWAQDSLQQAPRPQPWPTWQVVDFRPVQALQQFMQIRDAPAALGFAARYGPLFTCHVHEFPCIWPGTSLSSPWVRGGCAWRTFEPLHDWLAHATSVQTAVALIHKVRSGEPLQARELAALNPMARQQGPHILRSLTTNFPGSQPLVLSMHALSAFVTGRLQMYRVTYTLNHEFRPELWGGVGFLPKLWLQVAAVAAGGVAIAICSVCATPYTRTERATRRGQRNYCQPCNASGARQRMSRRLPANPPPTIKGVSR